MAEVTSDLVEVCVFRFQADRPQVLLLRRAADDPLYPGIWQNITGSLRVGEGALEGARRELQEETGLEPAKLWIVPHVSSFYDPVRDAVQLLPLFAAQVAVEAPVRLSREHDRWEWLALAEASRRLVWPAQRAGLEVVEEYLLRGQESARLSEVPLPARREEGPSS
jgi:8-oxo-dGTP pyrophosphatase MutT (NUDIX family)